MAIILPSQESLDPDAIRVLVAAYESALEALSATEPDLAVADETRDALALHIMILGLRGQRDPIRLAEGALAQLRRRTEAG